MKNILRFGMEELMQTIIIKLDSEKLENPDLDIIYQLPVRIEEVTDEKVYDNGYDYLTNEVIGVWLAAESAEEQYQDVLELLKKESFCGNDLSLSAEIYISKQDSAELSDCKKVYPV